MELHLQNLPIFAPQFAREHYRAMAYEEIEAARFLKKHGLHARAKTCLMNALMFKKASFQFKKAHLYKPTPR